MMITFNFSLFSDRGIIVISEESLGVNFTHWFWKRKSWQTAWSEIVAIDATFVEPGYMGFFIVMSDKRRALTTENMENWAEFEAAVRKRFPDFNWENLRHATHSLGAIFPCWKKRHETLPDCTDRRKVSPTSGLF